MLLTYTTFTMYSAHTHTQTVTELVASFPLEVGPERTVQAGIEE